MDGTGLAGVDRIASDSTGIEMSGAVRKGLAGMEWFRAEGTERMRPERMG